MTLDTAGRLSLSVDYCPIHNVNTTLAKLFERSRGTVQGQSSSFSIQRYALAIVILISGRGFRQARFLITEHAEGLTMEQISAQECALI